MPLTDGSADRLARRVVPWALAIMFALAALIAIISAGLAVVPMVGWGRAAVLAVVVGVVVGIVSVAWSLFANRLRRR